MIKKQRLFYIYIIVFIIIINVLSKSVFPRDDTPVNDNTEVAQTEVAKIPETKTTAQPEPTNVTNTDPQPDPQPDSQPEKPNPTNQVNPEGTETDLNSDNKASNTTEPINNPQPETENTDKESEEKVVISKVDSIYGSIEISYIEIPEKDKTRIYHLHLIIYFSSLLGILVLVCLIHSMVYIRPKIIEKRANKRRNKQLKNKKDSSLSNIDSNIGYGEDSSDAKLQEGKVGNESPAASIEYTSSSFNASSTDCIINLDKNSSIIPINRGKTGDKKKL